MKKVLPCTRASNEQMQFFSPAPMIEADSDRPRLSTNRPKTTLQDALPKESLLAVRQAESVTQISDLRNILAAALPQNSEATRVRYAESLVRWFFRDGLTGFAISTWKAYHDTTLQMAIHRYLYLSFEAIMGACVASVLPRLQEGIIVPPSFLISNTEKTIGHALVALSRKRLLANLRKLGFLEKTPGGDRVVAPPVNGTAFLLALHHAFAVDEPKTIEVAQIAANPFWYYLGLRNEDQLRDMLRAADHAGLIGKYVVADRLEQITTSLPLKDLIERQARL
jgi:hypothetical protein